MVCSCLRTARTSGFHQDTPRQPSTGVRGISAADLQHSSLTTKHRTRGDAEPGPEPTREVRRIRKSVTQGYFRNADVAPVRQEYLISGLQPAIPERTVERGAVHCKCPGKGAYGYAKFFRHAAAAEQRLEHLLSNDGDRQTVEVGNTTRKWMLLGTPAQQLLDGAGGNVVADSVRLDVRIKQIPRKGSDEPRRRRADDAANGLCAPGQFDHVLRESSGIRARKVYPQSRRRA